MAGENIILDDGGIDVLKGTSMLDLFIMDRDGVSDYLLKFEDGVDMIDITDFNVTWDSVMVQRVSLLEYKVHIRNEFFRVTFNQPDPMDIPANGWLLQEVDFVFATGVPDPPVQVHFEDTPGVVELIFGTPLPDVFVLQNDNMRDNVMDFEPGKDKIDLSAYNVAFGDLRLQARNNGKVAVVIVDENEGRDALTIRNISRDLTVGDIEADWFIF